MHRHPAGVTRALTLAATLAVTAVALPAQSGSASTTRPPFEIKNVSVAYSVADPGHPSVTYRLVCHLPKGSPYLSGTTYDSRVYLQEDRKWWHHHGPFEWPREYQCGETVTRALQTDSPGGYDATRGTGHISVGEYIQMNGTVVTARYDADARIRATR